MELAKHINDAEVIEEIDIDLMSSNLLVVGSVARSNSEELNETDVND